MTTKEQKRFELIAYYTGTLYLERTNYGLKTRSIADAIILADEVMKLYPEESEEAPTKDFSDGFCTGMDVQSEIVGMSAKELLRRMETYLANNGGTFPNWEFYSWARKEVYGG